MKRRLIHITNFDYKRLKRLTVVANEFTYEGPAYINDLNKELGKAKILRPEEIPDNVVTMNSKIRIRDLDTGEEMIYTLVFPDEANIDSGKISIMSPVGTAILGYSSGDSVSWPVPGGTCHIKIEEIIYQPESSGDYDI